MRRLAPVCLALAAALLGCSSGSGPGGEGAPGTAAESSAAPGGGAREERVGYVDLLPIARYGYTDAETAVIESAEQVLTRRCLRSFGIAYEPPAPEPESAPPADRRYGLSSASEAARLGYHPDLAPPPTGPDLPEDALRVFYGNRGAPAESGEKLRYKGRDVPAEGCFGQSVAHLAKKYDAPRQAETARSISTRSYTEALADPAVKAGFRTWSSCMRSSGFTYASPLDPLNEKAFPGEDVSAEEKATAVADVRCKKETGLLDTWFEAESALQQADIDRNAEALEELLAAHGRKVEAARRIVAEG
ncbi:hypothetical protein [Streptomyces sp. NPDC058867]|uniref:hypothetical protein n=1 Tax=unclassified Streptomyces TaxID=2593676 RepID=UPI0036C663C8